MWLAGRLLNVRRSRSSIPEILALNQSLSVLKMLLLRKCWLAALLMMKFVRTIQSMMERVCICKSSKRLRAPCLSNPVPQLNALILKRKGVIW